MATPLKDFRVAISEQIDTALNAQAIAFGEDKQTVARRVLAEWARLKHREHTIYANAVGANGLQMELDGLSTAEDGARRK